MQDPLRQRTALDRAHDAACEALLAERCRDAYWLGELSSSALATATAVSAMSVVQRAGRDHASDGAPLPPLIRAGVNWLAKTQNPDGGWGDTTESPSNISTTMLVHAALALADATDTLPEHAARATRYIESNGAAAAVAARYGKDRTFAVPILVNCALADQADWRDVAPLPFELACLPHSFYRFTRMHVVSYALPALIAIGQIIHIQRPTGNVLARWIRNRAVAPSLARLESIQPASGGFLEAVPLTSFVTMSLAAAGRVDHPVTRQGVSFIAGSARTDGSWPIDSNLSVWLTTLAVNALAADPRAGWLRSDEAVQTRDWILAQQLRCVHPYTNAAPGGWGWSHLSGSVPDCDDTAGALLALAALPVCDESAAAADRGIDWLLDIQNRDGGWPTFCRGWGKLPFDRSGTDLTAHAVRAMSTWCRNRGRPGIGPRQKRVAAQTARGFKFLRRVQQADGAWLPLWFGNHGTRDESNPTYGTARTLAAYRDTGEALSGLARRGVDWLIHSQNSDGGWGAGDDTPSTVEETALALDSLCGLAPAQESVIRAVRWLVDRVESGEWRKPSPIGLYFAKLWYFEKLYPLIFTAGALGRARHTLSVTSTPTPGC